MTIIQQYPDGVVYVGLGFLFGVLVGVLLRGCADNGNRAAELPVPETETKGATVKMFAQEVPKKHTA